MSEAGKITYEQFKKRYWEQYAEAGQTEFECEQAYRWFVSGICCLQKERNAHQTL